MLDLQERTTKPAAPAKLWRNWYRVHEMHGRDQARRRPGRHARPDLFSSKDIAEQKARDFIASVFPHARSWFDYIGALPEGEEPEA